MKLPGNPATTAFGAAAKSDAKGVPNALVWRYEADSKTPCSVRETWRVDARELVLAVLTRRVANPLASIGQV